MAHSSRTSNENNDEQAVHEFLRNEARIGNIESRAREYLDDRTYRNKICFDSGEYSDALELYAPVGSYIIQNIMDHQQDLDTIHLRRPAPDMLPIKILKIADEPDSYIIPSEILNIDAILPRSSQYRLEAITCEINQHNIVFMKHLSTNKWYYYQNDYTCEQFNNNLNDNLNQILHSRSSIEQKRLIESTHFLISMIFHNAVQYIYVRVDN
ncbi:unnamed protein product [Adineta steineri]|uniref:Uncharacterized protein n=1 Tax=Adineta steineri TaxID=433720 RepID=A0A813V9S1_9BILA|nr:unnamed protein product [Adineta steineri]